MGPYRKPGKGPPPPTRPIEIQEAKYARKLYHVSGAGMLRAICKELFPEYEFVVDNSANQCWFEVRARHSKDGSRFRVDFALPLFEAGPADETMRYIRRRIEEVRPYTKTEAASVFGLVATLIAPLVNDEWSVGRMALDYDY